MFFKTSRPDGAYLKGLHHFVKIIPYLMPRRTGASIFISQEIDLTHTLEFLRDFNRKRAEAGRQKLTFFQLFLCAGVRTLVQRPRMNRFVSGFRYYQRNEIVFNFVAKKKLTDDGEEINIRLPFSPYETLDSIGDRLASEIKGATKRGNDSDNLNKLIVSMPRGLVRFTVALIKWLDFHNILPKSLIDSTPFFCSVFLTNVGSIGVDAPYHHHYDIGNCGLFCSVGKIRRLWKPDETGKLVQKDILTVRYTYDDRVSDGVYAGRSLEVLKNLVEQPEPLVEEPVLSREQLEELKLRDYPPPGSEYEKAAGKLARKAGRRSRRKTEESGELSA